MKFSTLFLSVFLVSTLFSQHVNFNSQKNWSLNKKELLFGFGATQFNGDLGGGPTEGIDYSMKDIDWPSTGFKGMIGYRYRFHPSFATTTTLSYFTLKGDDKLSGEAIRRARNLNFKSSVFELQRQLRHAVRELAAAAGVQPPAPEAAAGHNSLFHLRSA